MNKTKIRWSDSTWNVMSGCSKVSPGCDRCYAETIAEKFRGSPAYPNGFDPVFKPQKLDQPRKWRSAPRRIFVNSMSDVFHEAFTVEQIDAVFDAMVATDVHDYLVLTKRPQRMARYFVGREQVERTWDDPGSDPVADVEAWMGSYGLLPPASPPEVEETIAPYSYKMPEGGWLERRGLDSVPGHIWLGTSIESDRYTFRADHLRRIPVPIRFLSLEPLLTALPSLDLDGIGWVIVGGESGKGFRPMQTEWAEDLRDRCATAGTAFYFKQSAAYRTEMGVELDGRRHEEYPRPHPALDGARHEPFPGIYLDPAEDAHPALAAT